MALGRSIPTAPSAITAASRTTWSRISGRTLFGLRRAGSAVNASTAAPTGSVAPPVKAITPLSPISTPGVARPWIASSEAMTENAVPTTNVRPSPRRAPWIVSASAASAAVSAVSPTPSKWTWFVNITCRCPNARWSANGISAASVPRMRTGTTCRVELRRIRHTKGPHPASCIPPTGEVGYRSGNARPHELPDAADLVEAELRVQLLGPVVAVGDEEDQVVTALLRLVAGMGDGRPCQASVPERLEGEHVLDLGGRPVGIELAVAR